MSSNQSTQKTANIILVACVLINLTVGVIYAWSVLKSKLTMSVDDGGFGWTKTEAGIPYSIAILTMATAMLVGGKLQDKFGPRLIITIGGSLTGLGMLIAGMAGNSKIGMILCFGVLAGIGMGFCYGCVTPAGVKWFHPSKKGLISGLIVGGFGLSAAIYAQLVRTLLESNSIETTLLYVGAGILVVTIIVAQFIKNPPAGYTPPVPASFSSAAAKAAPAVDFTTGEMMKTKSFYLMFIMFLLAASVGLMVIGNMAIIAKDQAKITDGATIALIVAFLAITNTAGRVIGGVVSDKIGRINTLYLVLFLQMVNMIAFQFYSSMALLAIGIVLVGFCYGSLLSVFPVLTADQFGLKNLGGNYGILFLSWGFAGVVTPITADYLYGLNSNYYTAYMICAVMLGLMLVVNFLLQKDIAARSAA